MFYKLQDDGTYLKVNFLTGDEFTTRILFDTFENGRIEVSTVFLSTSMGFVFDKPILFETMVFGGEYDLYTKRYTNIEDARRSHNEICDMVDKVKLNRDNKLKSLGL